MESLQNYGIAKSYRLLAQTPMIHFQPDQEGAALRATEVKPKLDRFLWERARVQGCALDQWRISDQHQALDYKMRIVAQEPHPEAGGICIKDCKAYFGNMGDGPEKALVFRHCRLEIICFIPELLAFIDEHITAFFVLHNFGTRQSKGFGSFLVDGTSNMQIRQIIEKECEHFFYADIRGRKDVRTGLTHAQAVYTFLKNGTNQTRYDVENDRYNYQERYIKGFALREYLPENVGGDKAFIKSQIVPSDYHRGKDNPASYDRYVFIRILLGMADHYEFRDDMRNGGLNFKGKYRPLKVNVVNFADTVDQDGKLSIPQSSLQKRLGIKRFQSPFLIKIFENRIFFILNDSYKQMLGQVFLLMKEEDYKRADKLIGSDIAHAQRLFENAGHLSTPDTFDPDDFITGFVAYFNKNRGLMENFMDLRVSAGLTLIKGGAASNG